MPSSQGVLCPLLGALVQVTHGHTESPARGHTDDDAQKPLSYEEKLTELGLFSLEK